MVVKHTYSRTRGTAKAAVKYYQLRPRGDSEEPRSIFGSEGNLSRREAIRYINSHQNGNYLVHRITLSPADDERPEDLEEMTRHAMRQWQREKGQELHWVAVVHRNTKHHHVHVVIAGTGERHSDDATRGVKITKEDHAFLREESRVYCRALGAVEDREETQQHRDGERPAGAGSQNTSVSGSTGDAHRDDEEGRGR